MFRWRVGPGPPGFVVLEMARPGNRTLRRLFSCIKQNRGRLETCQIQTIHTLYLCSFATDRGLAESAVRILESNGFSCWVAWRDIPEGVPYAAAIVQGIREARIVLVLLTSSSRVSPHVLREVETAVAANHPILSVQIAGSLPDEALGYYLGPT